MRPKACLYINKYVIPNLLLFIITQSSIAQQAEIQKEARVLIGLLKHEHYQPRDINDSFSVEVFNEFIQSLDPKRIYFTKADLQNLSRYKTLIDDDLNNNSWEVLSAITKLYEQKLIATEKTITDLLSKPLNFKSNDFISFYDSGDSVTFTADDKALIQKWNKLLKYDILYRMVNYYDKTDQTEAKFLQKEPELREKIKTIRVRVIKRILGHPEGFEKYAASIFLNSVASRFDPHTYYLSTSEWQNLESSISPEGYSFGLKFEESETGDITIAEIIPGGPAWKSNELHKEDIITELKWEGKEPIELAGADVSEIQSILNASNNTRLEIKIRRNNGQVKTVTLKKEKIKDEENIVKAFIIKAEEMHIGYISLPGFYSESDASQGKGCANDVAKEIIKLQKEHIDGLILDLRNNGGGPVIEGTNLAGIFVDEGPLFMMKSKAERPLIIKDMNRGTIYDGPLVIMVNGLSASASEIVTSTLQDYHRALIVGAPTYGKATAQRITPIDTNIRSVDDPKIIHSSLGATGITFAKLYRVTGESCQLDGVIPDIYLPDIYEKINFRESSNPLALPHDVITKKLYYNPLPPLPAKDLSLKSQERVMSNEKFKKVKAQAEKYSNILNEFKNIPLTYEGFKKKNAEIEQWWNLQEETEEKEPDLFTIDNINYDKEVLSIDSYGKEVNEGLIKKLHKDIYLEETFRIITDLIHLNNTKK